MDEESNNNPQPIVVNRPRQEARPQQTPPAAPKPSKAKRKGPKRVLLIVVTTITALILVWALWFFAVRPASTAAAIDSSKHQAVFFTNGQVYFGKLSVVNGEYMRLTNVYYLQTKSQNDEREASPQSASKQDANDVELIKLGNEIHGPNDEMIISKDQVLFFENLKTEGTVSKTIMSYQESRKP